MLETLEGESDADLNDARRLNGGRQPRYGAGDGELLDLKRLIEEVVGVDERTDTPAADAESLLEPRVDRHRKRKSRLAVGKGTDRLRALIQALHDHQAREVLAVLVAGDDSTIEVAPQLEHVGDLDRVAALGEHAALRVGVRVRVDVDL